MKLLSILKETVDEKVSFTDKYDNEMTGGQKELPNELQKAILKKKSVKKEGEDHEVSMAQSSLKVIIQSAQELMTKMGQEEKDIPGWIQDHITNAENYINQANKGYHEL